jgi:signal recognition particle subunit SRP19
MSHARIEEVSDSDPSEGDIDELDDFDDRDILLNRESYRPLQLSSQTAAHAAPPKFPDPPRPAANLINPSNIPSTSNSGANFGNPLGGTQFKNAVDEKKYKDFQCIYPIYFDKNRSRNEGRRVGIEGAVENPLARSIVDACGRLRLETLFEPAKCHPKDWGNPGRVKVKVKGKEALVKNSRWTGNIGIGSD